MHKHGRWFFLQKNSTCRDGYNFQQIESYLYAKVREQWCDAGPPQTVYKELLSAPWTTIPLSESTAWMRAVYTRFQKAQLFSDGEKSEITPERFMTSDEGRRTNEKLEVRREKGGVRREK
jgi:hypothetical protein